MLKNRHFCDGPILGTYSTEKFGKNGEAAIIASVDSELLIIPMKFCSLIVYNTNIIIKFGGIRTVIDEVIMGQSTNYKTLIVSSTRAMYKPNKIKFAQIFLYKEHTKLFITEGSWFPDLLFNCFHFRGWLSTADKVESILCLPFVLRTA